jgi:hypothetical protein
MGDYSGSTKVEASAGRLFGYLSDIGNLPRYFTAMTSAEPAGQDAEADRRPVPPAESPSGTTADNRGAAGRSVRPSP